MVVAGQLCNTGGGPVSSPKRLSCPPREEPSMVIRLRYAALAFSYATLTVTALTAWAGPTVSFENDVQPIFDTNCIICHATGAQPDLTDGVSYDNLVNQPTSDGCMAEVPGSVYVVPFDTQSSMLWLKTRPDDGRCGVPMPWGTEGLGIIDPDSFAIIDTWINEGALNN